MEYKFLDGRMYIHVEAIPNEPGFEDGGNQQKYDAAIRARFGTN
jgi:hypothetical protein